MCAMKLTELIRKVRNAKTQSEERKIIVTESAHIREVLAQKGSKNRARQVAKLIYIHTLGYPTHFGQIECITLMSSASYAEKRIGYLALMTLLDENEEILPLVEHTLKKDLDDTNQFVKALALTTLANIGSEDLCRDLTSNVESLLSSPPYIQKKVLMCAGRIVSRCPDLIDNFLPKIGSLIQSPKHGVVISVIDLITEFIKHDKRNRMRYRRYLPALIRLLKRCCLHNAALEYDVNGISDPFLIIKLLQLLKFLGEGSIRASEEMTDVLAQVSSQVEFGRGGVASRGQVNNTVAAILFQCVQTILGIESERSLKLVAQKILVKFLKYRKYNNLKYVSLAAFKQVLAFDPDFVKRYGDVIVDCLKNHDGSIRKQAVELIITMTDANNIKFLLGELLNYVQTTTTLSPGRDEEMESLTWDIFQLLNKYDPIGQTGNSLISWKVNTLIRVLLAAGPNVRREIATGFLKLISQAGTEQQGRTVRKLHLALVRIFEKPHLISKQNTTIQVCIYCVGEYGKLLYNNNNSREDEEEEEGEEEEKEKESKEEGEYLKLIQLLVSFYRCGGVTWKTRLYLLTALIKLFGFYESKGLGKCQARIREVFEGLASQGDSLDVEIQYRIKWFIKLIDHDDGNVRQKILEQMPDYDDDEDDDDDESSGESSEEEEVSEKEEKVEKKVIKKEEVKEEEEEEEVSLENLLDFGNNSSRPTKTTTDDPKKTPEGTPGLMDLLSGPILPDTSTTTPIKNNDGGNLMDLIGATPLIPDFGPVSPASGSSIGTDGSSLIMGGQDVEELMVYEDEDVRIDFDLLKINSKITEITAYFTNKTMVDFDNFKFLLSVPQYLKRNVEKPTSTSLAAIEKKGISQKIRIMNNSTNPRKKMVLRFKMEYERKDFGGAKTEKIRTLKNIPQKY